MQDIIKEGFKEIRKYSYLADKTTYEAYTGYLKNECTEVKNNTCDQRDIYDNCNHKNEIIGIGMLTQTFNMTFCINKSRICPYNIEHCEYNPYCKEYQPEKAKKDNIHLNCTFDNTKCKYYIDLKEKLKTDIEKYTNDLLRLKT